MRRKMGMKAERQKYYRRIAPILATVVAAQTQHLTPPLTVWRCTQCREWLPFDRFPTHSKAKYGKGCWCKSCQSKYMRNRYASNPKIRQNNREYMKKWRRDNKETLNRRNYINRNKTPKYRNYMRTYMKKRRKTDPVFRLNDNISRAIRLSLKGAKKRKPWESLVGYTLPELRARLESQFLPGMTWENHGSGGWDIDHIVPLSAFNFTSPEHIDFKRAWSLQNLRPIWHKANLEKHNKLPDAFQPSLQLSAPANPADLKKWKKRIESWESP